RCFTGEIFSVDPNIISMWHRKRNVGKNTTSKKWFRKTVDTKMCRRKIRQNDRWSGSDLAGQQPQTQGGKGSILHDGNINTYRRQNSSSYADAMAGFWFRLHLRPIAENLGRYTPTHRNDASNILAEYIVAFGDKECAMTQ